jgi:CheY-like chemotaxis protein
VTLVKRDRHAGKTILLVEDNLDNRVIYSTVLRHYGYTVLTVPTAELALPVARQDRPDLILMDIDLPGADGWSAIEALAQRDVTRGIPIVVISACLAQEGRDKARSLGCADFLEKPLKPTAVASAVARILDGGDPPPSAGGSWGSSMIAGLRRFRLG